MQDRHTDSLRYFNEQAFSTAKYIIPFIGKVKAVDAQNKVLEIGCGEAGNLKPFLDLGCECVGVDYSRLKIENGIAFYSTHPNHDKIKLISEDIYKTKEFDNQFDIIILRDVIEHIHDQDKFMGLLRNLLAPSGIVFFAFPPWQNPFGGHQQICVNKLLSILPYYHLLPVGLYRRFLKLFGESDGKISTLLEIKETGISLERFERIFKKQGYFLKQKTLYFINPNYEVKFGLKPRKLFGLLAAIPYFRNFVCTCGYYILTLK